METKLISLETEERRFELDQRKAKAYASSLMMPQHLRDIGSMMVLNQMSNDLKIPMLLLAQNIFMVKGKIGMSAQLVISLINSSGIYDADIKFEERTEPFGVRAYAFKEGERVDGIWIDEDMIVANGWYSNSNWKTLKPLMARYRSASYFARLNCPMVLMGFQTDDEIIDTTLTDQNTANKGSTLNQVVSVKAEDEKDLLESVEVEVAVAEDESPFDELRKKAREVGVKFRSDITYNTLLKKVESAEAEEVEEENPFMEEPAIEKIMTVRDEIDSIRKTEDRDEAVALARDLGVAHHHEATLGRLLELIERSLDSEV